MGRLNQIKNKLLELEGGSFQRLCDDWLHRKGYENVNPIGMMAATDRVVKGTPDSLFMLSNGKYVFSEYTVKQDRLAQKIEDDIRKCFDKEKTGISIDQIEEIIVCYLGKLSSIEINHLKSICHNSSIMLTLNGLDTLALSIQNSFPILSETYLGLSLDTGQLLTVDDFVIKYGQSYLSTSIDNPILFQDEALQNAVSLLDLSNFLLVSGASGVGKTLFSVNVVKALKAKETDLHVVCLFDKGADLTRDLSAKFSEPGDYLIFIDDANRLDNRIDYILHYLIDRDEARRFRILATVRDYARNSLIEKVKQYAHVHEQVINPLSNDQIRKITETIFDIRNPDYQERIIDIACGNPRLAVMAARVAIQTNQIDSIQNVTSLYDDYFGSNDRVMAVVQDRNLMAAACAISFFRKVDRLNNFQMAHIQNSFGIQPEEFWELVYILHKNEMVDLYENEVVRMSDQVLSTYLFYISVFENKIIPFSVIVNEFYPDFTGTIVDSLNPVISSFDHKKIISEIRAEVKAIFSVLTESNDVEKAIEFLSTFWFSLPVESLVFAKKIIDGMPLANIDWINESFIESKSNAEKGSLINLLTRFRFYHEDEFKISFDLLLTYLEKNVDALGVVVRNLLGLYNFKPNDWKNGYFVQNYVVDSLIKRMNYGESYLFSRIFILVAGAFLKVEHREHQWASGETFNIITFRLNPSDYQLKLRKKIINGLSVLLGARELNSNLMDFFHEYVSRMKFEGKEMVEHDLAFIEVDFVVKLEKNDLSHCLAMQSYWQNLESMKIDFPLEWVATFSNEILMLCDLLFEDRFEAQILDMGSQEFCDYRNKRFVDYFFGFTIEKFSIFMKDCVRLFNATPGRDRKHSLKNGVEISLNALIQAEPDISSECINLYFSYDDIFEVNPHQILNSLINTLSDDDIWSLINAKEYRWKNYWISTYFALLPENMVSQEKVLLLIEHISRAPSDQLRNWLDYLDKYQFFDSEIYFKIVTILVNRAKNDKYFGRPLGYLFGHQSVFFGRWFDDLMLGEKLTFDAYLAAFRVERFWDYTGASLELLAERNLNVLFILVDEIYGTEIWPDIYTNFPKLDFLWKRESYLNDVESYAKYIFQKERESFSGNDNIFCKLFIRQDGEVEPDEVAHKKWMFFRFSIENHSKNIQYICFIFNAAQYLHKDLKLELLQLFVDRNNNFNDFKTLNYEFSASMWSGSRVPILEKEKNFLEELLPLVNTIDLLEHKAYVQEQIDERENLIEIEKKRDFLESR